MLQDDPARPLLKPLLAVLGWIESGGCIIEDRDTGTIGPLVLNRVQRRLFRKMIRQAQAGKPIRIIKPKARKMGVSTLVQAIFDKLCELLPARRALTYAHTDEAVKDIFRLARLIHTSGRFEDDDTAKTSMEYRNGSLYTCGTLGAKGAARGGTPHYLHICELAALQSKTGIDAKAIGAMLNAVPDMPHTIIIIESTGDGPAGEFYRMCCDSRDGNNEYELDFSPWYHDDRYARDVPPGFALTESEAGLMRRHGLTERQIAWMRFKRANQPNEQIFKREFPTAFDDCFAAAANRVYPGFLSSPVKEGGHVGKTRLRPSWSLYRSIDWGAGGEHPFVCVWIAHAPDENPGLMVSPDCKAVLDEFLAYCRDNRTGRPLKAMDHAMDAIRNCIATFNLTGFVYVYRCLYLTDPPSLDRIAEQIHKLSGWELPEGAPPSDISVYRRGGDGEEYEDSCADRSQPKTIEMFRAWGIEPLTGDRDPTDSRTGRGKVEDGVAMVQTLISGKTRFEPRDIDPAKAIHATLAQSPRRKVALSIEERRILREERRALMEDYATVDDDDPMGSL